MKAYTFNVIVAHFEGRPCPCWLTLRMAVEVPLTAVSQDRNGASVSNGGTMKRDTESARVTM